MLPLSSAMVDAARGCAVVVVVVSSPVVVVSSPIDCEAPVYWDAPLYRGAVFPSFESYCAAGRTDVVSIYRALDSEDDSPDEAPGPIGEKSDGSVGVVSEFVSPSSPGNGIGLGGVFDDSFGSPSSAAAISF